MNNATISAMNEYEGGLLLRQWGIPVIEGMLVSDCAQAKQAAKEMGYPVAVKICSHEILHKTDKGGVELNIGNSRDLESAVANMLLRFAGTDHALIVQKMAPRGVELILGARQDPVFGPIVLAGIGGIFTEILKDTVIDLAPVGIKAAHSMIRRLKGFALLNGYRSLPRADVAAAAQALSALSRLITKRRDICEIDINPFIAHPHAGVAVDALVRTNGRARASTRRFPHKSTVDAFFNPSAMALIGASKNRGKGGNIILRNMIKAGFQGRIYPINPSAQEIMGMKAYPGIADVPEKVDLAMIVIPKTALSQAIADCAAKGITNIIVSTGGYSDIGETGKAEQEDLVKQARSAGVRLMGPNSIGTLNPHAGLSTSIVGLEPIRPGGVSLIGQSGVFSSGWGRWIADFKPFGLAKVACIGNKGDINESDLLEYLADDDRTTTIGMYLEGIVHGPRFVRAASRACRRKPVVVMKSGRSEAGAAAIASHTGSLAGSDEVFNMVCRKTGMVRVHDSEAFFDTLSAFESLRLPRGNRMGVVSISGMGCVVTTDAASEHGIDLPLLKPRTVTRLREVMPAWAPLRNPVDIWSAVEQHGSIRTMNHIARCLLDQRDIDALLISFVLMPESIFNIEEAFGGLIQQYPD
ncbi:MAG TPA: hypothetical protein ENN05_07085, partial [Deltaproteobacteria bacterium]|nr:hypothetical protein [Deltaproteobacteria bacterium]